MKNLEDIIEPLQAELAQFEAYFERTLRAETEPMNSIMLYLQNTKGKRLRPMLVLLSAKLFGEVNERTLRAATFVEMVHSATLIHDDVVDDDNLRRGQASVKAHWGNASAVLAGDYLLAKALLLIANDADLLNEMLRTSIAMSEGELMQNPSFEGMSYRARPSIDTLPRSSVGMTWTEGRSVSMPSKATIYLDIITRKTATLMRSCCTAGAMSVGATDEQIQQVSDFGLHFGILFQLRDDLLDGENSEMAKTLLPEYLDKAMKALQGLPPSATLDALKDLTVFCAQRKK